MSGPFPKVGLVESGPPEAVLGLTRVMEPPLAPERPTVAHEGPQILCSDLLFLPYYWPGEESVVNTVILSNAPFTMSLLLVKWWFTAHLFKVGLLRSNSKHSKRSKPPTG